MAVEGLAWGDSENLVVAEVLVVVEGGGWGSSGSGMDVPPDKGWLKRNTGVTVTPLAT